MAEGQSWIERVIVRRLSLIETLGHLLLALALSIALLLVFLS